MAAPASIRVEERPWGRFTIRRGLASPPGHGKVRTKLDDLIALAHEMQPGEAVALTLSESQQMRVILAAMGYDCVTDGWNCPDHAKTHVFKLQHHES